MNYFKAWYRKTSESGSLDPEYPDWVVYAPDQDAARVLVMDNINRHEPERGYGVYITACRDEDEGMAAFAQARQSGQSLM